MNSFARFILAGLQRKPMYDGSARPTLTAFRAAKKSRRTAKASRRANRG